MKYSNTVEYNIKTSLDSKGLTQLKSELQGLELKLQNMGNKGLLDKKTFVEARNQIQGLGQALSDAFNPSLGMLDLSKLNQELKNNDVTAQGLKTAFTSLGAEGQVAFNNLVGELGKLDTGILRTNSQIDKLFTTFSNTFRWGLVSSFFSQFMNAIHSSAEYVRELDDSLTQIMLVTDYNRDSMNEFARSANEAAKAVSMTTTGMTNASLIFAQQGYDLNQSQELATLSAKVANASQQDTATTSDQITAYMNAYGLENNISELTQAMDNWALIANISAADVGELAQASQRAASMANAVGVSGEQLASQIATIESVTREAPEQIGNGLKTLYARFSDIASGKEDEDGFTLGKVTSELNKIGVQVLDEMGQIRDVGDIMEDLMVIWDDLDQTSKVAASQALAGKYQVNRFMALMDNSDMYEEYKGATGANATGTLDIMSEEYADSIAGRSAKLQASLEGLFSTIFNTDDIYPWMDAAQGAVDLLQQFFDALGGGKTVLLGISSLLMQVFSKNMAQEINNAATNRAVQQQKLENLQNSQAALTTLGAANPNPNDANSQNIINFAQYMQANAKNFNAEQMDQANSILQELIQNSNAATMAADKLKESLSVIGTGITATTGESILAPFLDSEGAVNATLLSEALQNMSQSEVAEMFSHIQEDIKPAREGLLEFNKALQNYQQELRNVNSTDDNWSQSLSNLKAALDNLEGKIDPGTYERYEQAVRDIAEVTDDAGDKTAETTAEVAKLADRLEKIAAKDLTNLNQLNNDAFQAKNTQMAAEDSNKVAGAFQEGMGSQGYIQEILDTMNAVQQLTFAWQAFQSLGSLWANEDLSTGEKVLQTIMNLTMAMPQLISAVQTLQDNSFLQNIGNGLMGILNGNFTTVGDLEEIGKNNVLARIQKIMAVQDEGIAAYDKVIEELGEGSQEVNKSLEILYKGGEAATDVLQDVDDGLIELAKNGEYTEVELTGLAKVFAEGVSAAMVEGATGAGLFAGGLKAVAAAAWEFVTGPAAPFIIAAAAIGAIAVAIGQAQEQAKKAKEEALKAFDEAQSKLEQIQSLREKINSFEENYNTFKESGEGGKELAAEAEEIAKAMKDAGMETQAAAIHLAAAKAEASGLAKDFKALNEEMQKAQFEAEIKANNDVIKASEEVLQTQGKSMEEMIQKQELLKQKQQELNNLDPWDPNYNSRKLELENLISTLKETIGAEQEAMNAAQAAMNAQGQITGINALGLNGNNNGLQTYALGTDYGQTQADTVRSADAESLRTFFSQNVQGFDSLSSAEQLDFMLQNVRDDAQKAAIELQQLLEANENLSSSRFVGAHRENGENIPTQVFNDYEDITRDIENSDMSAQEGLSLVASLDKDASAEKIKEAIAEVKAEMEENGGDFELAIKATLSEEEKDNLKNQVRDSISGMEPEDSDIDKDAFQEMAKYFSEGAGELEDVPEEISYSSEALADFTEAVLRYDNAIQDADEHLADWKETLEDSSSSIGDQAEAFEGLRDLVGDLLDLDTSDLSHGFMESADTLDLLDEAIYGTGEEADNAYDRLNTLANLDMGGFIDWSDGTAQLSDHFIELQDSVKDLPAEVQDNAQYAMDSLQGIMNGEISGPDLNIDNYLAGLESMVNSGEMSIDDAIAAIDGAGVDADVETETQENTDNTETVGWRAVQGEPLKVEARDIPVVPQGGFIEAGGQIQKQDFAGSVDSWTYEPDTKNETKKEETTVSGYKLKGSKNAQGKVHFKNGRLKNGASGSQKRNLSGNGGHSRPSSGGKGGGGGKSCFVAGTLVTTLTGFSPIEQIKQGDVVLSYNELLHQLEYSMVVQTMIHDVVEPIYTLHIKNEQLRVTGIHRFLVSHDIFHSTAQWVPAADLQIGDWMFLADGTWHLIHSIEVNIEHQIVYNFEVAENHNYYVGCNQILAHNKGGSGGKKGGGGSGGKAKTIENKEKKEHKKDYYEEVNTQLEKTEKILSKIEKEEDRLIGDKARANQNKQLSLLQKEIELNKEKQKIQQQELKDVDELMKKRAKEARELAIKNGITTIIPSPIYDEDGAIANYEEMSAAIDKIHNQFIDQYNAAAKAGNEELTKEIQKTLEKFDKYGEDLLKNAQRHDKLQSEIEETINTLEELEDSIEDIRIEAFKAHQEAQDDLKDLKEDAAELAAIFRDFNDDGFLTSWSLDDTPIDDMIKAMHELDDIYAVTQEDANSFYQDLIDKKEEALKNTTDKDEIAAIQSAIQYFQEQQANLGPDNLQNGLLGLANQDLDKLKGWIEGTNTEPNPFGENTAALWEAYEDAYKRATDLFKDWRETVQDLRDSIIDTYDEQEDAINNNIDEYDRLLDHLERINDTYTLYYGEDSYDNILTIMDRQGATMQQQLNDLTAAFNYWEQRYQEAIATGDEKLIQEIREKMEDAEDAMYDKAEELAEHWVDRYEKAVDASIQKIDIKLWGGGPGQTDLEDQSTIWELQKDYMNTYRDDVEKAYEVDKLRSKYIDLLNDAQGMSLGTQNRIRKQMEDQLKLLENQNTVSEYDVKLANAKLEVLQKQMALEDAQRNKNKMQLRRDTQGNYRYVYRADEGNVKQAQDELAESEFDAYEMTKEQTIANNDRAISLYQDYMNKMRDIANKYQDDEVARNAALLALKEEYGKLLGALGEDFQNTTDGMYDVLTWLVKNGTEDTTTAAKNMMDQFYENAHTVKENTGNDWRDLATQITKDVLPNIQTAVGQGIENIDTEATNLSKNLVGDDGVLNKIKSSTKMLEQGMMDATDTTEKWAKATRDLFESFSPDNKKVQEAMTQLKQMEEQLSANQQATSALSTKYKEANAALQSKTAEAEHYKTALDFSTGAKQVKTGTVVKLKKGTAVHYSRNNSQTDKQGHYGWSLPYDMWVKFGEIDKGQANPYSFYATGDSLKQFGPIQNDDKSDNRGGEADTDKRHHQPWWFDQSELQKNVLAAMDTGGYTGDWNENTSLYKNGKIAMLHQKELVLNATDTQNILTAVNLMRDMIAGSANGLFNMNGLKNNISSSYNPVTEQRVEIQASFPNATDADDIRRALINLSDNAYQYSYRTR